MKLNEQYQKMVYLLELIQKGKAESASSLAFNLNVSERTVFRYIEELRMHGAEIYYSRCNNSYVLKNGFNISNFLKNPGSNN